MVALGVAVGGAVGACARYAIDWGLQARRSGGEVPVGTLTVNLVGAFLLGLLTGVADAHALSSTLSPTLETMLGTGVLGGFTTFSTFTFEAVDLAEAEAWRPLATYLVLTLVGGLLAAGAGLGLGSLS